MTRYIINIMGPQAVGKSTIIQELKDYLPEYSIFSIDDYRRRYSDATPEGEMKAWSKMFQWAGQAQNIIVESSGTSRNLRLFLTGLTEGKMIHILLSASTNTRESRHLMRLSAGYHVPPMYFPTNFYHDASCLYRPDVEIVTEKKQPYEVAAQIIESLPSAFI
mgnify:CR=1 FL=1